MPIQDGWTTALHYFLFNFVGKMFLGWFYGTYILEVAHENINFFRKGFFFLSEIKESVVLDVDTGFLFIIFLLSWQTGYRVHMLETSK